MIYSIKHDVMIQIAFYFFVWSLTILILQACLPDKAANRVKSTLKLMLNLLPISAVIRAFKNDK